MLDLDNSGSITAAELRAVLDDCCYTTSDDVFKQVVDIFDQDGDGCISYNELLSTLKKVVNGEMPKSASEGGQADASTEASQDAAKHDEEQERLNRRRSSFQNDCYVMPPASLNQEGALPSRFDRKQATIPQLGHGHLVICKSIAARLSAISDALKRLDYDRKHFISCDEFKIAIETYCGRVNPVLWDDIMHFLDPSITGLVEYAKVLADIKHQAEYDSFDDSDDEMGSPTAVDLSLRQGFKKGVGSPTAAHDGTSHHSFQKGSMVKNKGSAMGMGSHGSNDATAAMRFLCEKIYEKFPTIRNAFMTMDTDRGGTIGKRELKNILNSCCYSVPSDTFEELYRLVIYIDVYEVWTEAPCFQRTDGASEKNILKK